MGDDILLDENSLKLLDDLDAITTDAIVEPASNRWRLQRFKNLARI